MFSLRSQVLSRLNVIILTMGIFAATVASTALVLPAPVQAASIPLTLDHGHVDAIYLSAPNAKQLTLALREDVTGAAVVRDPASVILQVKPQAYTKITAKVKEIGVPTYALPQTQDQALLWPGWNTTDISSSGFSSTDIVFDQIHGPGKVFLFQYNSFGDISPVLKDGTIALKSGAIRSEAQPTHTHAYWAFSVPGRYEMRVHAQARGKDGQIYQSNPATYTWDVVRSSADTATPAPTATPTATSSSTPGGNATEPAPTLAPNKITPKRENSRSSGDSQCLPSWINRPATPSEIAAAKNSAAVRTHVGGAVTIPANTHVHPNWVFTAPGRYALRISQNAKLKNGQNLSATTTLNFQVGASGNANNGHFDFGSQINAGKLIPAIKDDRNAPATWLAPESLVFGLGTASRTKAPAGLGFIAAPGQEIWMIGFTQVAGVPWLGANTQHPSIIAQTTGPVTWRLESASGPGAVAVFSSGNFGSTVGQRWFGGAHQRPGNINIVNINGKAMVSTLVGRTRDGHECTLTPEQIAAAGGLAVTGISLWQPLAVLGLGSAVLGAGILTLRRSYR